MKEVKLLNLVAEKDWESIADIWEKEGMVDVDELITILEDLDSFGETINELTKVTAGAFNKLESVQDIKTIVVKIEKIMDLIDNTISDIKKKQ